jgi:regulator of protease activity HflC (stomatin/prohibitin superfamily)
MTDGVNHNAKSSLKITAAFAVVLMLFAVVLDGFTIIEPGERGVVVRLGEVTGESFDEGLHLKFPLADRIDEMSVQIKKFSAPDMQASSKDLQTVRTSCAVNYRLNPDSVTQVRQQIGVQQRTHELTVLQPQLQESIKAVTAKYNAQDLIAKRKTVSLEMRATFQKKLDNLVDGAFIVDEFSITDFTFSKTFTRAIEAKVEANERAMQAENEVRQAKAEAEKKVETARGHAESVRIEAQAEADAIRLRAQALREFPEVLKLDTIQRWDGKLPLVLGGESSDLMLELSNFTGAPMVRQSK